MAVMKMLVGGEISGGIITPTLSNRITSSDLIAGYNSTHGFAVSSGITTVGTGDIASGSVLLSGLKKPSANRTISQGIKYRQGAGQYAERDLTVNTNGELVLSGNAIGTGYTWSLSADYEL